MSNAFEGVSWNHPFGPSALGQGLHELGANWNAATAGVSLGGLLFGNDNQRLDENLSNMWDSAAANARSAWDDNTTAARITWDFNRAQGAIWWNGTGSTIFSGGPHSAPGPLSQPPATFTINYGSETDPPVFTDPWPFNLINW